MDLSIRSETFAADDQSWLGSAHGTDATRTVTIDVSTFTAGTHYPEGFLKSGLPLAVLPSGRYGLFDAAATNSQGTLVGFLFTPVKAPADTATPVYGAILRHGAVIASRLPVPVAEADRADVAGRIDFV